MNIPRKRNGREPPLALPVFPEDVVIDGPPGKYRFLAAFQRGAAAAASEVEFYVRDPADMPPVQTEVVLGGEDTPLAQWRTERGVRTRQFAPGTPSAREVILASTKPAAPGGAEAFRDLVWPKLGPDPVAERKRGRGLPGVSPAAPR